MVNFDHYTNKNIIEHNLKWPYIPDILIIGGSGSGKTNALLNLINNDTTLPSDDLLRFRKNLLR